MKYKKLPNVIVAAVVAYSLSAGTAQAGPLCTDAIFPVPLASFVSCVADGNDDLISVQAALDAALDPDVTLLAAGSFSPGPGTGMEFSGDTAGLLDIFPDTVAGSDTFRFDMIPPDTDFISIKQADGFEVFIVPGPTPFTLTHQLGGGDTSHISTFVSDLDGGPPGEIPEPGILVLMGTGLVAMGLIRRRRRVG